MSGVGAMMVGSNRTITSAGGSDADFSLVQLLLSGGEANGSTSINDRSNNNFDTGWTIGGNTAYSSLQAKWASTSIRFAGQGGIVRAYNSTNLVFPAYAASGETGDWTIEMWIRPTGGVAIMAGGLYAPLVIFYNGDGSVYVEMASGDSAFLPNGQFSSNQNPLTANAWNHFAIVRKNSTMYLWKNGASMLSAGSRTGVTGSQRTTSQNNWFEIGCFNGSTSNTLNAFIEDFRYTKGKARYTAAFSAPTAAFPTS